MPKKSAKENINNGSAPMKCQKRAQKETPINKQRLGTREMPKKSAKENINNGSAPMKCQKKSAKGKKLPNYSLLLIKGSRK
jgi:hypothetical protein